MPADQRAAIRPLVRELLVAKTRGESNWAQLTAEFSVPGRDEIWVQVQVRCVNFACPVLDPAATLAAAGIELLPGAEFIALEPGSFATCSHLSESANELAVFVDALMATFFGLPSDYPVDTSLFCAQAPEGPQA